MINFKQYHHNLNSSVKEIYTGQQHYQVNNLYCPKGSIIEVSPQAAKCWVLDITKLYSHIALRECLIAGILCNNSYLKNKQKESIVIGNPIEKALIAAASKANLDRFSFQQLMPKLDTIPHTSKFQYMATLHSNIQGKTIYIKGNPEIILPRAREMLDADGNTIDLDIESILFQIESMLEAGLQVIAFAKKQVSADKTSLDPTDIERDFVFLGLQGVEQHNNISACRHIRYCIHIIKNAFLGDRDRQLLQANYKQKTVQSLNRSTPLTGNGNNFKWQVNKQLDLDWRYIIILMFIVLFLMALVR